MLEIFLQVVIGATIIFVGDFISKKIKNNNIYPFGFLMGGLTVFAMLLIQKLMK